MGFFGEDVLHDVNVNVNVNVNNVNNKFIERTGTRVSSALGCHLQYCAILTYLFTKYKVLRFSQLFSSITVV